jgi:hypothetical protein
MLAVFTVNNLDDGAVTMPGDAPGTLRQAIFDANATPAADTIVFADGLAGTILLTAGQLEVTRALTITGPGAKQLTLEAFDPTSDPDNGDGNRIFLIEDGLPGANISVELSGLTLTGGDVAGDGGAILASENLTIRNSVITNNVASGDLFGVSGGGISVDGANLTVEGSTISNNRANHNSIARGGGISLGDGNLTLRNSTVSSNNAGPASFGATATAVGGGIDVSNGTHLFRHSTIVRNNTNGMTELGGGLHVFNSPGTTLDHTIVAYNFAITGRDISSVGAITSRYSLVENTAGWVLNDAGNNILNLDPLLTSELVDKGGSTPAHVPLAGSPIIDAGDPAAVLGVGTVPAFDQRGTPFVRIADGNANSIARIDIGAYEQQTVSGLNLVVDIATDEFDGNFAVGDLSLREAIGLANGSIGNNTITFVPQLSGQTILLTLGQLNISDSVTIDAATTTGSVVIDASGNDPTPHSSTSLGDGSRIFFIDDEDFDVQFDVTLRGLYLTGGDVTGRGGAINSSENLHLDRVTVHGNRATHGGGGVIQREGDAVLTIESSTISGNVAAGLTGPYAYGAGSFQSNGGGGLYVYGSQTTISNTTISGNVASGASAEGGGVVAASADTVIRHSTISGNSAPASGSRGGNIYFQNFGNWTLELNHTIVAAGTAPIGADIHSADPVLANYSLVNNVTGLTLQGFNNITGVSPRLGPLADNGGPTKTHALLSTSPAIDAGQITFTPPPTLDQRGGSFARVVNGNGDAFTVIDIGAYERQTIPGLSLVVSTTLDESDGNYAAGDLSLREAIGLANGSIGNDTITFAPALAGTTIVLTLGELCIVDDVVIDASSLGGSLTIDASGNDLTPTAVPSGDGSRVFNIDEGTTDQNRVVELRGLTLTGGDVAGHGGAILTSENLTVTGSTIHGNAAPLNRRGGGIEVEFGALTLNTSTIHSNSAGRGGGINIDKGVLTINSSTISGNSVTGNGGGIFAYGVGTSTTATVRHSTIAGNSANSGLGGGIFSSNPGSISLNHTIVADNTAPSGRDISSVSPVPLSYSLVENGTGFTPTGGPQFIGIDPLLGPLSSNGGLTQTHALLAGSPAIDAGQLGISSPPAFDQRGTPFSRVVDGNNDTFSVIDIGAYEFNLAPPPALPGDYNQNNNVDAGDYVLWRKTVGTTVAVPYRGADGNGDTSVNSADYVVWRQNFGDALPAAGSGTGTPTLLTDESVLATLPPAAEPETPFSRLYRPIVIYQQTSVEHPSAVPVESSEATAPSQDLALLAWLASYRPEPSQQLEHVDTNLCNNPLLASSGDEIANEVDAVFDLLSIGSL